MITEPYKTISIEIPLSVYEQLLIYALKNRTGVCDLLVSRLNIVIAFDAFKNDVHSFLSDFEDEADCALECPVVKIVAQFLSKIE